MVRVPPAGRRDAWVRDAREQLAIVSTPADVKGRRLQVLTGEGPQDTRSTNRDLADSYLNLHPVTAQSGGRRTDAAVRAALADAFPGRAVIQLDVDRATVGGGSFHRSTRQQPAT